MLVKIFSVNIWQQHSKSMMISLCQQLKMPTEIECNVKIKWITNVHFFSIFCTNVSITILAHTTAYSEYKNQRNTQLMSSQWKSNVNQQYKPTDKTLNDNGQVVIEVQHFELISE